MPMEFKELMSACLKNGPLVHCPVATNLLSNCNHGLQVASSPGSTPQLFFVHRVTQGTGEWSLGTRPVSRHTEEARWALKYVILVNQSNRFLINI